MDYVFPKKDVVSRRLNELSRNYIISFFRLTKCFFFLLEFHIIYRQFILLYSRRHRHWSGLLSCIHVFFCFQYCYFAYTNDTHIAGNIFLCQLIENAMFKDSLASQASCIEENHELSLNTWKKIISKMFYF